MYLRDLSLWRIGCGPNAAGTDRLDFNGTTHAAVEAYLDLLPRRRVVLADLAKVNVVVRQALVGAPLGWR